MDWLLALDAVAAEFGVSLARPDQAGEDAPDLEALVHAARRRLLLLWPATDGVTLDASLPALIESAQGVIVVMRTPQGYRLWQNGVWQHSDNLPDAVGTVLRVAAADMIDARGNDLLGERPSTHWLRAALHRLKPWYRDLLLASLVINVIALLIPLFTMNVYDRVVPNQAFDTLWVLALAVVVAVGFDSALRHARARITDMAGRELDQHVSRQLFARVLAMRLEARPQSIATFARQIQDFDSVRDFFTSATLVALVDLPFTLVFLAVIAWLGGWLVLVPVLALAALLLLTWWQRDKVRLAMDETARASSQRQAILLENLLAIVETKQLNAEGRMLARWEQTVAQLSDWNIAAREASNRLSHSASNAQQLVNVALVVGGVYLIAAGSLSMGGLIAITMLAGRASAAISQIAILAMRHQQTRTALTGLDAVMALPQENVGIHGVEPRRFNGGVRFDQVSFTYPGAGRPTLQDVALALQPGERVALVGKVGAGKSTLLSILAAQMQPGSGRVYFDGLEASVWPVHTLRARTGWLSQQPQLLFGSILDNLLLGQDGPVDEVRLKEALARTGVDVIATQLENGLSRSAGDLGIQLSGGQRQAVALARALLRQPSLLVLDEPTSAMDAESEATVIRGLASLPRTTTMVIATHRPQVMALCDRVIVLDGGRILSDKPRVERSASHRVRSVSLAPREEGV
ncbi:ATP-binding cassette domain-containing protein [Chitinibacteraceae bacterium HSL-7]